ncbi:MAG: S-layer homology domain-containing protein [Actinobacteria bacterium]|nr:S-layer homology domain-containing protein [Actinomycetota bacterium]
MIKGRNRIVAMTLVVAMILTMVPVAAFAHKVNPVPAKPNVAIGAISGAAANVTVEETFTTEFPVADTTVTVTLKDRNGTTGNVTFANIPSVSGSGAKSIQLINSHTLQFKINGDSAKTDKIDFTNINYAVLATTPTGDVKFEVAIGSETNTYSNATIVHGVAVARVGDKTSLSATGNSLSVAGIKLTESAAAQFQGGNKIKLSIENAGVTWTQVAITTVTTSTAGTSLELGTMTIVDSGKALEVTVNKASTEASTIEFGALKLDVSNTAATGDIKVAVTSTGPAPINPTSVAVAKLDVSGTIAAAATATSVTTGNGKAAGPITLTESQAKSFSASSGTNILKVKLKTGTFQSAPTAAATGGITFAVGSNTTSSTAGSLSPDFTEATWTINAQSSSAGVITISGLMINIPAGATGDIQADVSGGGISGTKTVTIATLGTTSIATVAAASKPAMKVNTPNQAAGDITITEAAAGSLATSGVIYLTIFGQNTTDNAIIFGALPTVKVTSGDLVVGTVVAASTVSTTATAEKFTIKIPVTTKSGTASTIKISGINYDISAKGASGDIVLDVRYIATDTGFANATRLATVANGFIGVVAPKFADVLSTHWAFSFIENLVAKGILAGYADGSFKPSGHITRAEFAKIAVVAKGLGTKTGSSFSDTSGHWAAGYIEAAKAAGIIGGYADGTFRPNAMITRAEIAKIVVVAAGFTINTSGAGFSDIASHWAKDYILTAANQGVVGGYADGTFKPNAHATRAEASKMVSVWVNK